MITPAPPMSLREAMVSQRSIRSYSPEAVPPATIRALLDAAVRAPTALHAEPWRFVVVQDRARLRRYSDLTKQILFRDAGVFRDLYHLEERPEAGTFNRMLADPDYNLFYDAGVLIAICARLTNAFVAADCWLAAQNLMLAARELGLGTCVIGSALAALNAGEVKAELKIPEDHTVVVAIIAGIAAEAPRPGVRKPPVVLSWTGATPEFDRPKD